MARGRLTDLWRDEAGVMTAETAMMVALLALAAFATWSRLANAVEGHAEASSKIFTERPEQADGTY